jgi:hypothetical protein
LARSMDEQAADNSPPPLRSSMISPFAGEMPGV